jgi:serine/threonine protein phosphatase PrpC
MIKYAAITGAGIYESNHDRIMVNGEIIANGSIEGSTASSLLATVCDGVGASAFGYEAAEVTSKVFSGLCDTKLTFEDIKSAISDANSRVISLQEADPVRATMATTLAGVAIDGSSCIIFNAGDSKVYRYRTPYIMQLSIDHTHAQEMVDFGIVESFDEINEKDKHIITKYIGDKHRCLPHVSGGEDRLFENDVYIICSDGLSDVISTDDLETLLSNDTELSDICETLYDLAIANGSQDNISVVIIKAE